MVYNELFRVEYYVCLFSPDVMQNMQCLHPIKGTSRVVIGGHDQFLLVYDIASQDIVHKVKLVHM